MLQLIDEEDRYSQENRDIIQKLTFSLDKLGKYQPPPGYQREEGPKKIKNYNLGKSLRLESARQSEHSRGMSLDLNNPRTVEDTRSFRQAQAAKQREIISSTPVAKSVIGRNQRGRLPPRSPLGSGPFSEYRLASFDQHSMIESVNPDISLFKKGGDVSLSPSRNGQHPANAFPRKPSPLQAEQGKQQEASSVRESLEGITTPPNNYQMIMDDEAEYPHINAQVVQPAHYQPRSEKKKLPPFRLEDAAAQDQNFDKERKRKLKALMNMGIIEKINTEEPVRLPPIDTRRGSRGNVMSVETSFGESPRQHVFSEVPIGKHSNVSPTTIRSQPVTTMNYKEARRMIPRKFISKSPDQASSKETLEITQKDLIEVEQSKHLSKRLNQWQGFNVNQDYLRQRKIAQRKKEYWKRRIQSDFMPKKDTKKQFELEMLKERAKLQQLQKNFKKQPKVRLEDLSKIKKV